MDMSLGYGSVSEDDVDMSLGYGNSVEGKMVLSLLSHFSRVRLCVTP